MSFKVYVALGFHINFYHSWRGDTPDEAGFGTDMRVIRGILDILDRANAAGKEVSFTWPSEYGNERATGSGAEFSAFEISEPRRVKEFPSAGSAMNREAARTRRQAVMASCRLRPPIESEER